MRFLFFWGFGFALTALASSALAQDTLPGQAPPKPDAPATGKPGGGAKPTPVPGPAKPGVAKPPEPPKPGAGAAAKPEKPSAAPSADAGDDDDDFEPPSIKKKATTEPATEARPTGDEPASPPLADPRIDEQSPRPFLRVPRASNRDRHVEVGPDVGIWSRSAKGSGVEYSPGLAYGGHARAELFPFLGFRAYVMHANHEVEVSDSELGITDQPALSVFQIGARLEPTIMPIPTLRLWAGLGVAWGRASAPEPTTNELQDPAERTGVFVEWSGALGATYDVIPTWLAVTAAVSGGTLTNQTGSMFEKRQEIDKNGLFSQIGALPEFKSSFSALVGVGMIL